MYIQRVRVEHWRGLTHELGGLEAGLNLIAGPNESGKSRLVEALRFALFESTSGQAAHKKNLRTWGVAAAEKPRVEVEFELAGTVWQLEKVFLGQGHNTRLRGGGREYQGEEAEAVLAELLCVSAIKGSKEVKPEDRGVWSLLWVEQGGSHEPPAHTAESQTRILNQLTDEIGEVAAGEFGQKMLTLAEAHRNRYFTPKSGAPKDTLTEPRKQVTELEERVAKAVARRAEITEAAEELERNRERIRDLKGRHEKTRTELDEITARHREAEKLQPQLEMAEERLRSADRTRHEAASRVEAALLQTRELEGLAQRLAEHQTRLEREDAARQERQQAFDRADAELAELETKIARCESVIRTQRRLKEVAAVRDELERARQRLAGARQLAARQDEVRAELAGLPRITGSDVAKLRQALEARTTARAQLKGASVSLTLTAQRDLTVDGEPLPEGESREILADDDRRVDIGDVVSLTVRPGAGDWVVLRDEVKEAERRVSKLLEDLNAADADDADRIARRRQELEQELERQKTSLEDRVPEGLDELGRRVRELEAVTAAAATSDESTPDDELFDPAALESAEAESRELDDARADTRARRDAANDQLGQAREQRAALASRLEAARAEHERLRQRLAEQPAIDELKTGQEDAERQYGESVAARDQIRRQFEAQGGERLSEDLERVSKAEKQLRQSLTDTRESCIKLETLLGAAGDDGRHEQVQELEAELQQARTALARVERDAAAAARLYEVLDREYKASRERLTQPVIQRIRPYLEDLFPGCEVWLDEELQLKGLKSAAAHEGFEFLSGGAREQLSLLVRIGLAEVLGAEESWPLVLDDVLVNTDAERIRRIQRALYHAGRKMQFLLFTCHGELFDALGPDAYLELPAPPTRRAAPEQNGSGAAS